MVSTAGTTQSASKAPAPVQSPSQLDFRVKATRMAFDRAGQDENVLLISGVPQT